VVQPDGTTCIESAQITGPVIVLSGARVFVDRSTIGGALVAEAPAFVRMCETTVKGAVSISRATGSVLIGDPGEVCAGNTIGGAVLLHDNKAVINVEGNHIAGP
jgi:hypothetical protein